MTYVRSANPAIREVTRGLAAARDAQILQAVAMVDAMPERGAADEIVAPLRSRLARLRPPRPLRFARLLFLPLDPLIVPAQRWRPGDPGIPRTAIPVLATAVEEGLGTLGQQISALISGRTTAETEVIESAGALLWPAAAACLHPAPIPRDWARTGLAPRLHAPLSRRIAALLSQTGSINAVAEAADAEMFQAILTGASAIDPDIWPSLVALLLARVPDAPPWLEQSARAQGPRAEAAMRGAEETAAALLLEQLDDGGAEARISGTDLADASGTVRRMTALLGILGHDGASASRRERAHRIRDRIRSACETVFTEHLAAAFLLPLRMPGAVEDADMVWGLESAARDLRTLETEARRAGGGKTYDRLLAEAAAEVRAATAGGGLGLAGAARLTEILLGPEAALALLGEEA